MHGTCMKIKKNICRVSIFINCTNTAQNPENKKAESLKTHEINPRINCLPRTRFPEMLTLQFPVATDLEKRRCL